MPEGIISDQKAWQIARRHVDERRAFPNSPLGVFAETGEIMASLASAARVGGDDLLHPTLRIGEEFWTYVAHHGERPAQPDWPTEDRGGR